VLCFVCDVLLVVSCVSFVVCFFVVCCLLFVVCCLLFVVCCLWFVVCCLLFVVCCLLLVVWCLVSGIRGIAPTSTRNLQPRTHSPQSPTLSTPETFGPRGARSAWREGASPRSTAPALGCRVQQIAHGVSFQQIVSGSRDRGV